MYYEFKKKKNFFEHTKVQFLFLYEFYSLEMIIFKYFTEILILLDCLIKFIFIILLQTLTPSPA